MKWKISAIKLIINRLRYSFCYPRILVFEWIMHVARHSFATNSLMMGANIAVVGSLLGHSGLRHTMRYLKAVDAQKREATNKMNFNI